jgi:hypothetical protein
MAQPTEPDKPLSTRNSFDALGAREGRSSEIGTINMWLSRETLSTILNTISFYTTTKHTGNLQVAKALKP